VIRAVAWDIDGTLIDSEPIHNAALAQVCGRYGAPFEPHDPRFLGVAMEEVYAQLSPLYPPDLTLAKWFDEIVAAYAAQADRLLPFPGAREAVASLHRIGVRQACVSNSVRRIVDANLARLDLGGAVAFSIAREDVANGKPDPEPYALACRRLGAAPHETLAVEDSDVGAASARAAGLRVLRVDGEGEAFAEVVALACGDAALSARLWRRPERNSG
jgi:beta-phosphoglucomutase-like phosphatase (HAD superfamily)